MDETSSDLNERLRRQRATLADFGLLAFRTDNLDELLSEAATLVSQALEVKLVKILEYQPATDELLIRAGVNWKPGVVGHVRFAADDRSPAGYALQREEAITTHDVAAEQRFGTPHVLKEHGVRSMINVIIPGTRRPFGVLEADAAEERHFHADDTAFMRNYANLLAAAIERLASQQAADTMLRQQRILSRELAHRVKNVFALVRALATQTHTSRDADAYRDVFLGRLAALAQAEDLLFDDHGQEVEMNRLIEAVIAPYRIEDHSLIEISGAPVLLDLRQARMLGLALHELATNAAKHGALSTGSGRIGISWELTDQDGRDVRLSWTERQGPRTAPPQAKGFGTRLLAEICPAELNGAAELSYVEEGYRYELLFPLRSAET